MPIDDIIKSVSICYESHTSQSWYLPTHLLNTIRN